MKTYFLVLIVVPLLLSGCINQASINGDGESSVVTVEEFVIKSAVSSKPSPIKSEELLLAVLKEGMKRQVRTPNLMLRGGPQIMMAEATVATTTAAVDTSISTTNLQVAGVDEADRMKSDGEYLYAIKTRKDHQQKNQLRVFKLSTNPVSSEHLADVEVGEIDDGTLNGIYLLDDQRLLLLYGGAGFHYYDLWWDPWRWQNQKHVVEIIDLKDVANPVLESRIEIDGIQVASRRVGDHLYILNRYTPQVAGFNPYPGDDAERRKNSDHLKDINLEDLLPKIKTASGKSSLVTVGNCFLPPIKDIEKLSADVISLIDIDLTTMNQWQSQSIIGATETMFMTPTSAYLATSKRNYDVNSEQVVYAEDFTTDVHKFSLTDSGPEYRGSGEVQGQLGWDRKKKPFRFGEYNGVVGVVTSEGNQWDNTSSTRLTLLHEGENQLLDQLATLPGLGKPGERLYASRFLGDRVYLVTFKKVDPLYVIDISDPENLQVGELEVPGFSDYLHPISGGLLLGVGKDAKDAEGSGDGRFAWYQGLKLSLYNVQDVLNPYELVSSIIGKRGTTSTANSDHHGFTWLPADSRKGRPARLAIPVSLHDEPVAVDAHPSQWSDWTYTGLIQFEVDDGENSGVPAINRLADMVVESRSSIQRYSRTGVYQDRSVIVGDKLFYLHGDQLYAGEWGNPNIMDGPVP